jgi:hypothetical protein
MLNTEPFCVSNVSATNSGKRDAMWRVAAVRTLVIVPFQGLFVVVVDVVMFVDV